MYFLQDISHGAGELCRETRAGRNLFSEKSGYLEIPASTGERVYISTSFMLVVTFFSMAYNSVFLTVQGIT